MKKLVSLMLIVFLVFTLFCFSVSAIAAGTENPIILRYAHVERIEDPQHRYATELADLVKELTEGRVIIQVYPNGQLGQVSEMIDGIKSGTISMGHHTFASLGKIVPNMSVFCAPYVFRDAEHGLKATIPTTSPVLQELNQQLIEKGNIRVIGSFTRGYRNLSCNFPVYSPDDLKGQKIRGIALPIWMSMLKGMGAIATPVAIAEVPTALMTGLVVGQENPLSTMWASKLYEVQKYIMMTEHMMDVLVVFINEKMWQSIPEADRVLFEKALSEMADRSLKWTIENEEDYKAKFREKGVTIIEKKDGLDVDAFRKAILAQINKDFPEWTEYIERIQDIK